MKPHKSRNIIPEVANHLSLNKELTENVINFYYDKVRETLNESTDLQISLDRLGTFQIKESSLLTYKKRFKSFIENTEPEKLSFIKYNKYSEVLKNFKKIDELLEKIEDEKTRKLLTKKNRTNVVNKDLEE